MANKRHVYLVQSLARLQQIASNLDQIERDERRELRSPKPSGPGGRSKLTREAQLLKVRNGYLRARAELYNETAQIEKNILQTLAKIPAKPSPEEVAAMAKRVGLAKVLRSRGSLPRKRKEPNGCKVFCTTCISSCTACVTRCTQCVGTTSCAVSGMPLGLY